MQKKLKPGSPFDVMLAVRGDTPPKRSDENDVLKKTIAERLIAARKINGWTQTEAAEQLGEGNSTQLSLWEAADRMIPLAKLVRVADVYSVSVDYLVGLSEEPERDARVAERASVMRQLGSMMNNMSLMLATQLQRYLEGGAPAVLATRTLLSKSEEFANAVARLRELNPQAFDEELRGAPTVLRLHDEMIERVTEARRVLDRHERIGEEVIRNVSGRLGLSMPLFDEHKG